MSELDAGTVSAPQSSSDIAASVVSDAEHAESSTPDTAPSDTRIDTTSLTEDSNKPPTAEPTTAAELSAAAKFLEKQGHRLKKEDGRDVWLPAKTVEKMLDRYVEDHRSTWNGEKTTLESRSKTYEDHINSLRSAVAGDPRAFLGELAKVDPRYAAFLEQKIQEQQAPDLDEPKPDIDLGNGRWTFSQEQNDKRIEWKARQLLNEELKPFREREKTERERAEQSRVMDAMSARTQEQITEAKAWPGFADHEADILKALQDDSAEAARAGVRPRLSLEGAYRRVVMAKMQEDDTKRRERILKEMEASTVAPALSRQTADTPRKSGPRTSAEIAREAIAKLERG